MQRFTIYQFQRQLSTQLLAWSGFSVLTGLAMQLVKDPFWRAKGQQHAAWGAIDAGIALVGQKSTAQKETAPDALSPNVQRREASNLKRVLLINAALDVGYVLGGLWLTQRSDSARLSRRQWQGHGLGVIIQGGFLLLFDLWQAKRVAQLEAGLGDVADE